MDKIDKAILIALQQDGKISNSELAKKVALSESACLRRVKNLWESNVILNTYAQVNPQAVGLPTSVFVRVSLDTQQDDSLEKFEASVKTVPEVMECYLMSGDVDYILRVVVKDAADYERIHHSLIRLPGVARVHSSFALRTVLKRNSLPLQ